MDKTARVAISLEVGDDKANIVLQLVPVGDGKCQQIIEVQLSNGFRNTTTLPPSDCKRAMQKLQQIASSADPQKLQSTIKKVVMFMSVFGD